MNLSYHSDLDYPHEHTVNHCTRRTRFRLSWRKIMPLVVLGGWCLGLAMAPATAAVPEGKLLVAATISPLGDFCRKIGGDLAQVQVLIPPGASPHVFEPAPSVMARAAQARVFVYIGAGLEPWADKLLRARGPGKITVVEAAGGMPLIREVEEHHYGEAASGEGHEGHSHAAGNPHIWLDPVLAQEICRKIAGAFMQADPSHRAQYAAHLKDYLAALTELDREIEGRAQRWRRKDFVAFHPAFSYFARRYGLHEVGIIEAAPGREPTPRHLQNLVTAIRRYKIKVVFAEPQLNPRVAEVVAAEAGVKVLMLDPVGGRPPYGSDYLKLMRYNLATLDQALK
jgi:zinc transport system substrate-binding protein